MKIKQILLLLFLMPYMSFAGTITDNINDFIFGKSVSVSNILDVSGTNIGAAVAAQGVTQGTVVAWQNSVSGRLDNASSLTNWPVQFSIYSNNITGSNDILTANGNCQILVVTNACTNYLPARLTTAFECMYIGFNISSNTFAINTNNVIISTNYFGQGSWPVFRTNGVQGIQFIGNYGVSQWSAFPL